MRWILFGAALLAVVPLQRAQAEGIRQEPLQIPAVIGGRTYRLEGLVVRPDDGQPHPLALINHGSPRDAADRPGMSPNRLWLQAAAFARRGWTAVTFLRRGYGHSGGGWVENYGSCGSPDYTSGGRTAAADLAAVARYMLGQPYVTKDKWISVGVSAGGFATIALTADAPPGLSRRSRLRRAGGRAMPMRSAARGSWSRPLPPSARPRVRRCCGCRRRTIISSARGWCRI